MKDGTKIFIGVVVIMVIIMASQGDKKESDNWVSKDPKSISTSIGADGQLGYLNVIYDISNLDDYKLNVKHGTLNTYEITDLSSCSISSNELKIRLISWGFKNPTHMMRESYVECYDGNGWVQIGNKDDSSQAGSLGSGDKEVNMYDNNFNTGAVREASKWGSFSGDWSSAIYEQELLVRTQTPLCSSNSDCGSSGYFGDPWCDWNEDVRREYKTYTCNNAGTLSSYCSNEDEVRIVEACVNCEEGECVGGTCNTPADLDCNNCVDDSEFPTAVFNWKEQTGDIPDSLFPSVVYQWKTQEGC